MTRCVLLLVPLLAGCAAARPQVPPHPPPAPSVAGYRVGCPDVLRVSFADRSGWDSVASVDVDGTLPLGAAGRPRVDGLTADEVRAAVAAVAGVEPDRVSVAVAAPRAGRVFVSGPDNRRTRALPYPGPVRVLDFLARHDALPPNEADLTDVYVVRPNVAAGRPAEVFPVTAAAGPFGDPATDIELQPGDRVYVGETRRASFVRLLPEWLAPLYRRIVGLL